METNPLKFKIKLSEDQIQLIKSLNTEINDEINFDEDSFQELIEEIIKDFSKIDKDGKNIERMIISYMYSLDESEHGAPDIHNYTLESLSTDLNNLVGHFELCYTVYYYYGCDDINQESEEYLNFNFHINLEEGFINFESQNNFTRFSPE